MKRPEIIAQIKQVVSAQKPKVEVWLYGSEARGDARPDSDIDLLMLVNEPSLTLEKEEELTLPLYLLELKTGVQISPLVMTKEQWENRPFNTPFYINVKNEGILL